MNNKSLLKYVMKVDKADVLHSSAYGKAQNSGALGTASTESFEARRQIDSNRRVVKGYGHSGVARQAIGNGPRAKTYTPPTPSTPGAQSAAARPIPPRINPGISR